MPIPALSYTSIACSRRDHREHWSREATCRKHRQQGDDNRWYPQGHFVVGKTRSPRGTDVMRWLIALSLRNRIVEKQLGANTLTVTRGVEEASRALLIGCVLVALLLMVFLADWRTALISSVAISLSLLAAGLLLHSRGGTLDTMVL
jgi:hypothetical protein